MRGIKAKIDIVREREIEIAKDRLRKKVTLKSKIQSPFHSIQKVFVKVFSSFCHFFRTEISFKVFRNFCSLSPALKMRLLYCRYGLYRQRQFFIRN